MEVFQIQTRVSFEKEIFWLVIYLKKDILVHEILNTNILRYELLKKKPAFLEASIFKILTFRLYTP